MKTSETLIAVIAVIIGTTWGGIIGYDLGKFDGAVSHAKGEMSVTYVTNVTTNVTTSVIVKSKE